MSKITPEEIKKDIIISMDSSFEDLKKKLHPVFHDKIEYVNGKLLKDCFKHIKDIIQCHNYLRKELEK